MKKLATKHSYFQIVEYDDSQCWVTLNEQFPIKGLRLALVEPGWRLNRWRAPKLECHDRPSRVELVLPMVSLIPEETLLHLRAMLGVAIDSLTPSELQALATAALENSVSNIRLQELLPDHPVEISRMLTRLCERGLLVSDNRRRWATYRLGAGDPRFLKPMVRQGILSLRYPNAPNRPDQAYTATVD
jgi:hypothetical protein